VKGHRWQVIDERWGGRICANSSSCPKGSAYASENLLNKRDPRNLGLPSRPVNQLLDEHRELLLRSARYRRLWLPKELTLMRMAARPFQTVPPHQHAPEVWIEAITRLVLPFAIGPAFRPSSGRTRLAIPLVARSSSHASAAGKAVDRPVRQPG
jgi:hypothetical protein